MTIALVAGPVANKPRNGGAAWTRLSWVLGLRRLGFEVHLVEEIPPEACVDEDGGAAPFERSVNLAFFREVTEAFGLGPSATLVLGEGKRTYGLPLPDLEALAADADLLVNLSGHLSIEKLKAGPRVRAYVDQDPAFTQFWHAAGDPGPRLEGHDVYATVGLNVGTPGCPIPTGDIRWLPLGPVTLLQEWPPVSAGSPGVLTTVGSWRGPYGPVEHGGRTYGVKVHEWRRFLDLPRRVPQTLEAALDIHPADVKDREALLRHGWRLADPREVAGDPLAFRRYVQRSGGEFSVAQGVYVDTGSGWFSSRTAHYLASGKPALVQDTGFSRVYPVGEGLVPFRTLDEAVAGARSIATDHDRHSRAARTFAEAHLDSDRVLGGLLEAAGVAP